jgi:hypothetical protein
MRCASCGYTLIVDALGALRATRWVIEKRDKRWTHYPCRPGQHRALSVMRDLAEVVHS